MSTTSTTPTPPGGFIQSIEASNQLIREVVEARNAARAFQTQEFDQELQDDVDTAASMDTSPIPEIEDSVHPASQRFFSLCEQIKEMHRRKSADYGSETDPLANIRNGAAFVGIEPWRAAMVRLSDKVTRIATYNRTGSLQYEGVVDSLLDLASYSLLALLLYEEERDEIRKP
jgi:hypothetical protein